MASRFGSWLRAARVPEPELVGLAREIASAAGALLLERFRAPASGVRRKSTLTDLVSDADRDAEALIERMLRDARPGDGLIAEEGARVESASGLRWLVDPLDGTINFLYGIPQWCVSIACVDDAGPRVGVISDPCRGELFVAERGAGATLDGKHLAVSEQADLGQALLATGFAYDAAFRRLQAENVAQVLPHVRDIRRLGSAALDLAWLAGARYDAYFESGVNPWDTAAGILLVREAGGAVTEVDRVGRDARPGVIASNGRLHERLSRLLTARAG
jgi:myo-inositol-1(or 4)-monophosphatase